MTLSSSFQIVRRRLAGTAVAAVALSMALALAAPRGAAAANEVADWNVIGIDATVAGGQNPIHVSRTIAMMHLAMHDALNAIDRRYEPYLYFGPIDRSADAGAAVAAAARDVLVAVIPGLGHAGSAGQGTADRGGRLRRRPSRNCPKGRPRPRV